MEYKSTLTYKDIIEIVNLLGEFKIDIPGSGLSGYREVFLLGRGSSGNATLFAKYIWEIYCGVISNIVHPFSIFNLKRPMDFRSRLLFSFSQSGKSPDIVKASKIIKKMGAKLIALTNEPQIKENPLASISDYHILLSSSKEIPVAATKSFILQLWAVLKISTFWLSGFSENKFTKCIKEIDYVINNFEKFYSEYKLDSLTDFSIVGFVGRGPFNAIAEDSALKFREMAMIHSLGYSAAEFLHGPVGSYGVNDFVIILSGDKKLTDDLLLVENKLKEKKVRYLILYPFSSNYPFNALSVDVFMKLVALKLSVKKGLNPDNPAGLSKVTRTI